eukprot:1996801-Rhodomonas_salina.2
MRAELEAWLRAGLEAAKEYLSRKDTVDVPLWSDAACGVPLGVSGCWSGLFAEHQRGENKHKHCGL